MTEQKPIQFSPIGVVHSPHLKLTGMPIQPPAAKEFQGTIEILPEFSDGLNGIEEFTRIMLIYHLHKSIGCNLTVMPFLDTQSHGVFATRVPKRPNAIGFSVVRLLGREENTLHIRDVDILDGTPLLDIKPYVPVFDAYLNERYGWFEGKLNDIEQKRSDDRFVK